MYIAKIVLLKRINVFVPAMRCHQDHCNIVSGAKCQCKHEDLTCNHLASPDRKVAVAKARGLAKRAGVRSEC